MVKQKSVNAADVLWLLDTDFQPEVGLSVSTIASAIREARALTGREPETGAMVDVRHAGTWAGALVWFIVLEQLGTCFQPIPSENKRDSKGAIARSLIWYAGVGPNAAHELHHLRDRFAHDYTLEGSRGRRYRLTRREDVPLFTPHNVRPRVSLYHLAEAAERAASSVRSLAQKGSLTTGSVGDMATVLRRFSMVLETDDV